MHFVEVSINQCLLKYLRIIIKTPSSSILFSKFYSADIFTRNRSEEVLVKHSQNFILFGLVLLHLQLKIYDIRMFNLQFIHINIRRSKIDSCFILKLIYTLTDIYMWANLMVYIYIPLSKLCVTIENH